MNLLAPSIYLAIGFILGVACADWFAHIDPPPTPPTFCNEACPQRPECDGLQAGNGTGDTQ